MTPTERKRLRELAEKATAAPWHTWGDDWVVGPIPTYDEPGTNEPVCHCSEFNAIPDAEFIAAARTAVPQLLDLVDKLESIIADEPSENDAIGAEFVISFILRERIALLTEALEKIADPAATELGCVMHIANEALQKIRGEG